MFEPHTFNELLQLLAIVLPILGYLWHLGLFKVIIPRLTSFGPQAILYMEYQGSYDRKLEKLFQATEIKASKLQVIRNLPATFGLYFDNKHTVRDTNKLRAIIGFFISPMNQNDPMVSEFLKTNPDFKFAYLPQFRTLAVNFPYRNFLSLTLAPWKALSPIFKQYKQLREAEIKLETVGILEIYDLTLRKEIQTHLPFGEGLRSQFPQSSFSEPEQKPRTQQKIE